MRLQRFCFLLCLLVPLAACQTIGVVSNPPRVHLADIKPLSGGGGIFAQQFGVSFIVENPNNAVLQIDGISYDLRVNGQPLMSGQSGQSGRINAFSQGNVGVLSSVSTLNILNQVLGAGREQGLSYQLDGRIYYRGGPRNGVPFRDGGAFNFGL